MIRTKPCFSKIGEPGKRYALPNSSIMIHQPSGGAAGQASDIAIHAREILRVRERLNRIFQKHTGIRDLEAIGKCVYVGGWVENEYTECIDPCVPFFFPAMGVQKK